MPLVTDVEVKQIIDTTRDTTPFIIDADDIISERLSASGLSSATLKRIEKYLAAHLVSITDREGGLTSLKVGDTTEKYGELTGKYLEATRWGQMVLLLDTTGTMKGSQGNSASFRTV